MSEKEKEREIERERKGTRMKDTAREKQRLKRKQFQRISILQDHYSRSETYHVCPLSRTKVEIKIVAFVRVAVELSETIEIVTGVRIGFYGETRRDGRRRTRGRSRTEGRRENSKPRVYDAAHTMTSRFAENVDAQVATGASCHGHEG